MTTVATNRLAYLVSQYPSVTHTFILREIRALRDLGFDVEPISIRPPDFRSGQLPEVEKEEYRRTFTVLGAGPVAIVAAHAATFSRRPVSYFAGVWAALRLGRADLPKTMSNLLYFAEAVVAGHQMHRLGLKHVHSHFASTVALFLVRVFPVTFSATIHGPDEFGDVVGFHMAEKVARAKFLCAISQYARSQMMKASDPSHWGKLEVCPLGVDPQIFLPRAHRDELERVELLCVGRLAPAKAQQLLLKAIGRLVRDGRRSLHLRLVGDGPDRRALERTIVDLGIQDNVTLEGACNQDRVKQFYRQADLFVLASFAEGVPVVLMEAMAMEIPCVATWVTGVPELIRHGVDGWLIPPADEEQLACAIGMLIDDPELRQRLGKSARARVEEKYNLGRNIERLAGIYRRRLSIEDK